MKTVLIVDDDDAFRRLVLDILRDDGYRLFEASSGEEALETMRRRPVDLLLTDRRMPGIDGVELAGRALAGSDPPAVVLITAHGTIPDAVSAIRTGVVDYLTKPLDHPRTLRRLVRRILDGERPRGPQREIVTSDPALLEVLALADRAAATEATVLISGESGTGKELLAHRLHRSSPRSDGPLVVVNCAALPETLAESELFGHEKGAFTGAVQRHRGRFEVADGGTLVLDEIGELTEPIQAKLLRALESRTVERVGGERPIPTDVRLVASTNRHLPTEVAAGRFRRDLYYRLDVVHLHIPPLRERPGDVRLLLPRLVEELADELGVAALPFSGDAVDRLAAAPWPGNVRQLRNVVQRALIATSGPTVGAGDLPELGDELAPSPGGGAPLTLEARERRAILEALERTGGHRERTADLLGISVRTLYNRLREYGIG